jgi:hypothetical protein
MFQAIIHITTAAAVALSLLLVGCGDRNDKRGGESVSRAPSERPADTSPTPEQGTPGPSDTTKRPDETTRY